MSMYKAIASVQVFPTLNTQLFFFLDKSNYIMVQLTVHVSVSVLQVLCFIKNVAKHFFFTFS